MQPVYHESLSYAVVDITYVSCFCTHAHQPKRLELVVQSHNIYFLHEGVAQ